MAKSSPSERRKTKQDRKAKARYKVYKKGGSMRATKIRLTNKEK